MTRHIANFDFIRAHTKTLLLIIGNEDTPMFEKSVEVCANKSSNILFS